MIKQYNEKGYALLIVLFTIVFITIITAVFMRAALSNATQEKTVDENNLVVVAAETGLKYYTWDLEQFFDEEQDLLKEEFSRLVNEKTTAKKAPLNHKDYEDIQRDIASIFEPVLKKQLDLLEGENAIDLFSGYKHKLLSAIAKRTESAGDILFIVEGTVEGTLKKNSQSETKTEPKTLDFEMIFKIPKIQFAESGNPDDTSSSGENIVFMPELKVPKKPASPVELVGISKQPNTCVSSNLKIENQKCNISGISEAIFTINKSNVYIENTLNSWGKVKIENSFLNIRKDFTPAEIEIEDTDLLVAGTVTGYKAFKMNKSNIQAKSFNNSGGTALITNSQMNISNSLEFQAANIENSIISANLYKANSQANFNKTDLKITTNYNSGGANFTNSNLEVGTKLDTGGGLFYVEGSNVKIVGDAHTANGSTIKSSVINIGGYFLHTSKPLDAENSDISVGGKVTATNGTNLSKVNMNVLGGYESSTAFTLSKSNLSIAGNLTLGNGGTLNSESLLIANQITSSTSLVLNGSVASTNYLKSDVMRLNNSNVCAKDFEVRDLGMDNNSTVYYLNSSNHTNKKSIIKLPPEEFGKKCGLANSTKPGQTGMMEWEAPVLDKVTY